MSLCINRATVCRTFQLLNQCPYRLLQQWSSVLIAKTGTGLKQLDLNRDLDSANGYDSDLVLKTGLNRFSPVLKTGLNRFSLGAKRFGFPRGTKPKPQYKWRWDKLEEMTGGKYTHKPLHVPKAGGRHPETGKKVNVHVGGGVAFDYYMVDMHRRGPSAQGAYYEERVLEVRKDPNRTCFIALVAGTKGKRWILATENMQAGQIIKTTAFIPKNPIRAEEGDAHPVGALAPGSLINCVEVYPGRGGSQIIHAGSAAIILRHHDGMTVLKYPNKREFAIKKECMVTVGRLSNPQWKDLRWGSPNMHRRFGWRMGSGLWHRKDQYCGRKPRAPIPIKYFDQPPRPPRESAAVTLTKRDLDCTYGTAASNKWFMLDEKN